jgi:hypothetical protein
VFFLMAVNLGLYALTALAPPPAAAWVTILHPCSQALFRPP